MSHVHHTVSYDSLTNPEEWLMPDPSPFSDPLSALLAAEYEQEAEIAGYESVADYLHSNPSVLNLH